MEIFPVIKRKRAVGEKRHRSREPVEEGETSAASEDLRKTCGLCNISCPLRFAGQYPRTSDHRISFDPRLISGCSLTGVLFFSWALSVTVENSTHHS